MLSTGPVDTTKRSGISQLWSDGYSALRVGSSYVTASACIAIGPAQPGDAPFCSFADLHETEFVAKPNFS